MKMKMRARVTTLTQSLGLAPETSLKSYDATANVRPSHRLCIPARTKTNCDRDLGTLLIRGFDGFR